MLSPMSDLVESSKVKAVMAQRELETQVNLVRQRWVIAVISFLVIFSSIFLLFPKTQVMFCFAF